MGENKAILIPASPLMLVHDLMDFGKHKGKTVDTIAEQDPGYLLWCLREGVIRLPDGARQVLEENLQRNKAAQEREERTVQDRFRSYFPPMDFDPFADDCDVQDYF